MELQYCKIKLDTPIKRIVSDKSISNWQNDSLYVYIDDLEAFYLNYNNMFVGGIYANKKSGDIDIYGINYFSPEKVLIAINNIEKNIPQDKEILLDWLKKSSKYNGIYILGI